jgi:hypothetical protein
MKGKACQCPGRGHEGLFERRQPLTELKASVGALDRLQGAACNAAQTPDHQTALHTSSSTLRGSSDHRSCAISRSLSFSTVE